MLEKHPPIDLFKSLIYNVYMIDIENRLRKYAKEDLDKFKYFHKTGKGGYAQHDVFLCVTVPDTRIVAKQCYSQISLEEIEKLLDSKYHEVRLCAVVMLVLKMDKEDNKKIVDCYLRNAHKVNGWDLVDVSAPKILGKYILENKEERKLLYVLANEDNLWKQRISVVANLELIKKGEYTDILQISKMFFSTKHDLIQKAVGWMLREVGNKNFEIELNFLKEHYNLMPRTMLRYAIEKFDEDIRKKFLRGEM